MIDVDREHRKRSRHLSAGKYRVDSLRQPPPIGETGQWIELRHLLQASVFRFQLGLNSQDALGDRQPDDQFFLIHWFGQEVVGSRGQARQTVEAIGSTGHHQDISVRMPSSSTNLAAELDSVHIGHHPVGDQHPPVTALDEFKRRDAGSEELRLMTEVSERSAECEAEGFLIVDDEDLHV